MTDQIRLGSATFICCLLLFFPCLTAWRTRRRRTSRRRRRPRSQWWRRSPGRDRLSPKKQRRPSCPVCLPSWTSTWTRCWWDLTIPTTKFFFPPNSFITSGQIWMNFAAQSLFAATIECLSFQNYLARNFYNMRFLALFVCFAINFILLFYKVTHTHTRDTTHTYLPVCLYEFVYRCIQNLFLFVFGLFQSESIDTTNRKGQKLIWQKQSCLFFNFINTLNVIKWKEEERKLAHTYRFQHT